jgi:DNA-directed RNA polymerase subunit beta
LTKTVLADLDREQWFKLKLSDSDLNSQLASAKRLLDEQNTQLEERYEIKREKLQSGDDLAPGVLKIVKVYLAVKRRIQPGDKMAGPAR